MFVFNDNIGQVTNLDMVLGVACRTISVPYVLDVDEPINCVSPMPRLRQP